MNNYLIPWHSDDEIDILSIKARNYNECLDKLKKHLGDKFDIDDMLDYPEFQEQLSDKCGVYLGEIYDINEFL